MAKRILMLAVVLVMVLAPALAMAVSNCAGMSTDCEGPCGTTAGVANVVMSSIPHPSQPANLAAISHAPVVPVLLLDLPPRP